MDGKVSKQMKKCGLISTIPSDDPLYNFVNVYRQVYNTSEPFGKVHKMCRLYFGTKRNSYAKR